MKDFYYRTVSEEAEVLDEDGEQIKVRVSRTRTSNGFLNIVVEFGSQKIEFNIEEHARMVRDMLTKICNNPCELPKIYTEPR